MDTVVDIAQVIAMIAALAAVTYAEQAVVETRALRREERIARLLELIADVGEAGVRAAYGQVAELLALRRQRLKAALSATGEPRPACELLVALEWPMFIGDPDAVARQAEGVAAVDAALHEVADLLVRLRAQGSWVLD